MALATLTGNLQDFTLQPIKGARLWVHPLQSSASGVSLFVDKPVEVEVGADGAFSVHIEDQNRYELEIIFPDFERDRMGRATLGSFRVPIGGGPAGEVVGLPSANGMVRVLRSAPSNTTYDQYVYDESTGNLFERTS